MRLILDFSLEIFVKSREALNGEKMWKDCDENTKKVNFISPYKLLLPVKHWHYLELFLKIDRDMGDTKFSG